MKFIVEVWFDPADKDVEFECDPQWQNDGIGSYEFWGTPGYDHGIDYVSLTHIEWDKSLYTDEENDEIKKQYHRIIDKIIEQVEKDAE